MVKTVTVEASLLLQIENEGSDFLVTDLSRIWANSSRYEKIYQVIEAVGDYGYGIGAFTSLAAQSW